MLDFLYTGVSWVLLRWHDLFTFLGLNAASGVNWSLSIIFLVITARLLLFRFFLKQVHYQRNMQEMQPRLQAIKEKYKNDRQAQQREMMRLQQEEGFNPLAGCLPMLLQIPIFISLFHVLRHLSNSVSLCPPGVPPNPKLTLYSFTATQTCDAAQAKLFGAPLAANIRDSPATITQLLGGDVTATRVVIIVLVVISAAATFYTQILVRQSQVTVPVGTAATVQRLMLWGIPVSVLFSGFFFPLGVLLYWFTSNVWTMGQQLYINKFHPHVPKEAPPAGELGKSLAPKPGQKPVRTDRRVVTPPPETPDGSAAGSAADNPDGATASGGGASGGSSGSAPRSSTPRPGQRPNRQGAGSSSRPGGKRPNQSKKRR
jgi:YidC/Oxa1 family membrane protein insertase